MVISNERLERPKERNSTIRGLRAKFGIMPPPIRSDLGVKSGKGIIISDDVLQKIKEKKFQSEQLPVDPTGPSGLAGVIIPKKRVIENVLPDSIIKINKPNVTYKSAIYKNPLM